MILNLGKGDWQQGLPVVMMQLWDNNQTTPIQVIGSLPPNPELALLYERWQGLYAALYAHRSWRSVRTFDNQVDNQVDDQVDDQVFEIEDDRTYITNVSEAEFQRTCKALEQHLNHWLNHDSFRVIDRQLRTRLTPADEIRVIISAENRQLLRLPWHLWQFFADYPRAEPGLSLPEYTRSIKTTTTPEVKLRILAILGNAQRINIAKDQQLLEQLPHTTLQVLVEPALTDINQQLWEPGWDILFFAGHSSSQGTGKIQINATESLTIEQLRFGLKKAIERGLKLAIFNSCDGLELAWALADLQIPQVIVMREPVPDRVAQEFLKAFLFAFSSGASFYLAVREAREQLQALETDFLCATWLPVICQNPAEPPMQWEWGGKPVAATKKLHSFKRQPFNAKLTQVLFTIVLTTGCLFGIRSLGILQPLELWAFDRALMLRPIETTDDRLLVITIDETDIQAQNPQQRQGSISDQTLDQLLKVLEKAQPRVIGLDVYRDFPTSTQYPNLIAQLRHNPRLVTLCKSRDVEVDVTGIAPPPEVAEAKVGFSDFLEDSDGVLRRQLLFHTPDPASPCTAPYAFNVRLAFRYLVQEQITPTFTPDGNLQLGETVFPRLQPHTGGYQSIDARGNQVILNYRSLPSPHAIAPRVSLAQVLKGQVNPASIRDRIVLIGVTANSSSDVWSTPYSTGLRSKVPGVFIQAQMTSQLLSAVLDQRPLIRVWAWGTEFVWIGTWAIISSFSAAWRQLRYRVMACAIASGMVISLSVVLLIQGLWVPLVPAVVAIVVTVSIINYLNNIPQK